MMMDCNKCRYCSPTEDKQTRDKEPHKCLQLNKVLFHGTNNKFHYAIIPHEECPINKPHVKVEFYMKNGRIVEGFIQTNYTQISNIIQTIFPINDGDWHQIYQGYEVYGFVNLCEIANFEIDMSRTYTQDEIDEWYCTLKRSE